MYQKEIIVQDSLWQSFVNGSREAYARLYELYVRPMYLYGLHFCDDRQIIEDAIHDIFVRIYVNRERLPELKNVKLYLLISLKNTLLNHANSKSFRFRMDISVCRQLHDQSDLEETIVRKEESDRSRQLVAEMERNLSASSLLSVRGANALQRDRSDDGDQQPVGQESGPFVDQENPRDLFPSLRGFPVTAFQLPVNVLAGKRSTFPVPPCPYTRSQR